MEQCPFTLKSVLSLLSGLFARQERRKLRKFLDPQ